MANTNTHSDHETRGGKITVASNSIGSMIGQFKSAVTKRINHRRGTPGAPVWQRNYWACPERRRREHIIRDDDDLSRIREYIRNNPMRWETDIDKSVDPT